MNFIPYSRQSVDQTDIDAVVAVLQSAYLTQGPQIPAFESAVAALHNVDHCVAVANATAALHLACLALDLGPGDLGWTVPNSFVASANCIRYCGADVDFVDIDPATRTMCPIALADKLAQAEQAGRLPDVVIPVDFAGYPADLPAIQKLADRYGFKIIEDASHALGASLDGAMVGSAWADVTVFSFHAVKIITTGEGGMCATNDPVVAERIRLLASHGITRNEAEMVGAPDGPWYYEQLALGYNYRMTDIQAALGHSQVGRLPEMHQRRAAQVARYDNAFAALPVKLVKAIPDSVSAHHLYVIEVDSARTSRTRHELFDHLRAAHIGTNVHYIPIHLQPDYRALGFREGQFPNAEAYYAAAVSLPLHPMLSIDDQNRVIDVVKTTFA